MSKHSGKSKATGQTSHSNAVSDNTLSKAQTDPGARQHASTGTEESRSADSLNPQELAEACAASMLQNDQASRHLDMQIESVAPGQATLSMKVTDTMTNGLKTCHGGYLFTLADSCFAFACNSYNQFAFAQQCAITYLAPAFEGDVLTATGSEQFRSGRSGLFDVIVTNQRDEKIASFRGNSRTVKGQHLP